MQRLVKGDFRCVFHAAVGKRLVFFHVKVGTDIQYLNVSLYLYNTGTISLSSFFQNIALFLSTPCTLAICVKCFISFFFFKTCSPFCAKKPTLFLFVAHFCIQNAVFFYLLKYCLFFFVTDFYVENPVFFILFFFFDVVRVPAFL